MALDLLLLAAFPVPLRLLVGLGVLLVGVLTAYWFFLAKNNPRSRKVDDLPADNDQRVLQDRRDKNEISENEFQEQSKSLDDEETKQR